MKTYDDVFPPGSVRPRGLFHVFGRPGVGKSTFCITVGVSPERIAVFDFESSLAPANDLLHFGVYHNMVAEWTASRGLTAPPRELYDYMLKLVGQLKDGAFDVIVVDNIEPLEVALEDAVESNPQAYGLTQGQIARMEALKWGAIKRLYAVLIQFMLGKAPLVGFTSHLRQVWAGSTPVPGLYQPRGKADVLEAQTFLRLWLNFRAEGPEPSGLVLKSRLATFVSTPDGQVIPRPVLPRRLPIATWDKIREYLKNPADLEHPAPGEMLSEEEAHQLRGTLSKEQYELLKAILQASREPASSEASSGPQMPGEQRLPANSAEFATMILSELGLTLDQALTKLGKRVTELDPPADYLRLKAMV